MQHSRTIILHIGAPKTGTTSVQKFLELGYQNRDRTSGLWYAPLQGFRERHDELARSVRRKTSRETFETFFAPLRDMPDNTTAVLSAEGLGAFAADRVIDAVPKDILEEREVNFRVLGYVRPHISGFLSIYQQFVKSGNWHHTLTRQVERLLRDPGPQRAKWLEGYRAVIGDRLIARPFHRPILADGDIVADFIATVAPYLSGAVEVPAEKISAKQSLSVPELVIMRHVHPRLPKERSVHDRRRMSREIVRRALKGKSPENVRLEFGPEDLARLQVACRPDAQALERIMACGDVFEAELAAARPGARTTPMEIEHYFSATDIDGINSLTAEVIAHAQPGKRPAGGNR